MVAHDDLVGGVVAMKEEESPSCLQPRTRKEEYGLAVTRKTGPSDAAATSTKVDIVESSPSEPSDAAASSTKVDIVDKQQHSPPSDAEIIVLAEKLVQDDQLLAAARLLQQVDDTTLLDEKHQKMLQTAKQFEVTVQDLRSSPSSHGWTKQGESHGQYDTIIYYKVDDASRLTARIETPIEPSLLVPLISVFNESDLYETWIPHWTHPRMGIKKSVKLHQSGRANQVILVTGEMPWPLADREVVFEAMAIDDIDANGHIVVKMEHRNDDNDDIVPPPQDGAVRVDYSGGILCRKCPEHHESLRKSKTVHHSGSEVLVTFMMFCDAHIQFVPQNWINFVTRTVLGQIWSMQLDVARDIRDGKRPQHAEAIAAKREQLYDWVDERIAIMLDGIPTEAA